MNNDIICAISTAPGQGAMAIVRLSGMGSFDLVNTIFEARKKGFDITDVLSSTVHFGNINDETNTIDEVLVAFFKGPKTYTGEDIVEVTCHGSVYIQQQILQLLIKKGARLANPGEFTQRAYMNGKMDLSQAEAVSDLIASSTAAAHKIAMNQMRGGISNELIRLRGELLQFISLIELELDFGEEDVEFADREKLQNIINEISSIIKALVQSFELGNAIKNGIPVAIVGEPNVGKSTLLNAILNEDKAIVSEIAGTTRDAIEDTFNLKGITYRFIDTAGLRETSDVIESIGIERTYQKIEQAKIVLVLFDVNRAESAITEELQRMLEKVGEGKKVIVVFNKIDQKDVEPISFDSMMVYGQVSISAKEQVNLEALMQMISNASQIDKLEGDNIIISNMRHVSALNLALEALGRASEGMGMGITNDFLAMDIREAIHFLAGITGEEISTDEILGNIFGQFCIGK